jgi:RHS repeat-associated protein
MSALLRLCVLFALIASLIVPDSRVFAYEPDPGWDGSPPRTKLILAQPGQTKEAAHDGVTIELGPRAVATDTPISITPLTQQELPALDPGMTNVTQGPRGGYRFLPHGTRFQEKIRLSVPYDKTLIPPGLTAQDIKTFYFDEQTGSWKALERVTVDAQAGAIISLTDHFTDMINATVTVPDHPEALSYNHPGGQVPLKKDQYFYHADHLGSTGYVTDANGDLYQHIEYFPFGETWVEEASNTQRTPYLFTAKELDEETGLYYYGARYYDPRTSVWQSTDPILEKYLPRGKDMDQGDEDTRKLPDTRSKDKEQLPGMGGVYNSLNLGLYSYSHQNPVRYKDPDGRQVWEGLRRKSNEIKKEIVRSKDAFVRRYHEINVRLGNPQDGRIVAIGYTSRFKKGTMGRLALVASVLFYIPARNIASGKIDEYYRNVEETTGILSKPVTKERIRWLAVNETKWWNQQAGLPGRVGSWMSAETRENILLSTAHILCLCRKIPEK